MSSHFFLGPMVVLAASLTLQATPLEETGCRVASGALDPAPSLEIIMTPETGTTVLFGLAGLTLAGSSLLCQKLLGNAIALCYTGTYLAGFFAAHAIWKMLLDERIDQALSKRFASAYQGPLPATPEFAKLVRKWEKATGFVDFLYQHRAKLENHLFLAALLRQSGQKELIADHFYCVIDADSFTFIPKQYYQAYWHSWLDCLRAGDSYLFEQNNKRETAAQALRLLALIAASEDLLNNVRFVRIESSLETQRTTQLHDKTTNSVAVVTSHETVVVDNKIREKTTTLRPPIQLSCFNKAMVNDLLKLHGLYPVDPIEIVQCGY